ncbi:uncharacterized protein BDR25DRAFT_305007 [Lindgomyces ingoldianus]|uniref:Uncharacterized protein n=1 Tax=Lindgomyces ingoldianus TaxID=673940 RepID=A0ACB6QP27_9PLEO|nr:uncharacterized protein BDR25DRAFT_305007 [Lindgomyces ingoldianus]KAF2468630.1 hypothetical protein BDR25DRAFT_305007 [Lindgomyces ingoldianus]
MAMLCACFLCSCPRWAAICIVYNSFGNVGYYGWTSEWEKEKFFMAIMDGIVVYVAM